MSEDFPIFRPRLNFEREFGQHRNWWVRDPRLVGNPVSVLLYLLSHQQDHAVTQTQAMRELQLGKDAWVAAKRKLMAAGFLVEIRDRYPRGFRDSEDRPRGGQKRFRLVLQDPEPGTFIPAERAVIELDMPYESAGITPGHSQCGNSVVAAAASADNPQWTPKPQVRASADNPQSGSASADNPQSFKGREERLVRSGLDTSSNQPTITNASAPAQEASVDAELAELLPTVHPPLTVASIRRELAGRVNVEDIDVVTLVKETVLRSKKPIPQPAAYVAAILVRNPQTWHRENVAAAPGGFQPAQEVTPVGLTGEPVHHIADCLRGEHDWGHSSWREVDRSHCVHCSEPRRLHDPAFAELEAEFEAVGTTRKVSA